MARALWNGKVIAEADTYEKVEGNVYFPPKAIRWEYFRTIDKTSICPWKGTASYYTLVIASKENEAAAWTYHEPKEAARQIKDHVAFWKGVTVEE